MQEKCIAHMAGMLSRLKMLISVIRIRILQICSASELPLLVSDETKDGAN